MQISCNNFCTDFIIFDYLKKNIEIKYSKETETEWKNIFKKMTTPYSHVTTIEDYQFSKL